MKKGLGCMLAMALMFAEFELLLSKTLDKWKRTQKTSTLLKQSNYRLFGGGVDAGDVGRHRLGVEVANR